MDIIPFLALRNVYNIMNSPEALLDSTSITDDEGSFATGFGVNADPPKQYIGYFNIPNDLYAGEFNAPYLEEDVNTVDVIDGISILQRIGIKPNSFSTSPSKSISYTIDIINSSTNEAILSSTVSVKANNKYINFVYKSSVQKESFKWGDIDAQYNALSTVRNRAWKDCYNAYFEYIKNNFSINNNNINNKFFLYPQYNLCFFANGQSINNGPVLTIINKKADFDFKPLIVSFHDIDQMANGLYDYALKTENNYINQCLYSLTFYMNINLLKFGTKTCIYNYQYTEGKYSLQNSDSASATANINNNDSNPMYNSLKNAFNETIKLNMQLAYEHSS